MEFSSIGLVIHDLLPHFLMQDALAHPPTATTRKNAHPTANAQEGRWPMVRPQPHPLSSSLSPRGLDIVSRQAQSGCSGRLGWVGMACWLGMS
jgi:hypothetical protein